MQVAAEPESPILPLLDEGATSSSSASVPGPAACRLKAYEYVHVEDIRSGEVLTLLGPLVFPLLAHQKLLHASPQPCVVVPPNHYAVVDSPVRRDGPEAASAAARAAAEYPLICVDTTRLRYPTACVCCTGTREIRFSQPPFPLFPGERVVSTVQEQPLLEREEALLLECTEAFVDEVTGQRRQPGEKYYYTGPGRYTPRVEERRRGRVRAVVATSTQALHLVATQEFVELDGTRRVAGERWTVRTRGVFFPPPCARVERVAESIPLSTTESLLVHATGDFTDHYTQQQRRAGDRWLVTCESAKNAFVPCHLEHVAARASHVILKERQYCVVSSPVSDRGANGLQVRWGARELRVGPQSFFMYPSEVMLHGGVRDACTLADDEALLVRANDAFTDRGGTRREATARWLVKGPCSYIPELEVAVLERRRVIPLSQDEGVYVRNVCTGEIKSIYGHPFLLSEEEELWEKPLSRYTRRLMAAPRLSIRAQEEPDIIADWESSSVGGAAAMLLGNSIIGGVMETAETTQRPRPSVVTPAAVERSPEVKLQPTDMRPYAVVGVNVEHNTLVRLHDMNSGQTRVVAGPAAVRLEPYEEFAPVALSGGRPKLPNQIHTLSLFLGPDYMSDAIEVETLDHARLKLELAYNWEFDATDLTHTLRNVFTIPDFVGEACKTLASRVRVAIASATFESFHRNSATVVKRAIFSAAVDGSTEMRGDALYFLVSALRITNVDLQSVEPVDPKTRLALAKSVQLAVEIITKSQENEATHHAMLSEQEARGALDLQVVSDRAAAERERVGLMEVVVHNAGVEQSSASKVQALAESEARTVDAESERDVTPQRCAAHEAGVDAELLLLRRRMELDLAHRRAINALQETHAAQLADIEAQKYEAIMEAVGPDTLAAIARAGPELKAQLLGALGLKGFLVTDGSSPINLVSLAEGITEPAAKPH